ncbi:hypothetical protein DFH06DRAFT_1150050 [Mycena polygramma]|nr:hypothetical protein DFH06DRAFT_1150050 [Mycena polygramma]
MFGPIAYEEVAYEEVLQGLQDRLAYLASSKPRTKSQGKEAATATSGKKIERMPALQGSSSEPERQEPRVGIPEFITQSRETQERAAEQSYRVVVGVSQKVAAKDRMWRSKGELGSKGKGKDVDGQNKQYIRAKFGQK